MNVKPMWPILREVLAKRRWQAALLAVCASLLTALLLGVSWYRSVEGARSASMAQLGNAAAAQLAALAIEPLITLDRIRLAVLATRMSELPELESITIVTVDDRIMANAGPRASADVQLFTHAVEFEGAVAGYVQVAVAADAFSETRDVTTYLLLPALIAALLAAAGGYLLGLRIDPSMAIEPPVEDAGETVAERPASVTHWLLAVNLFNLITLAAQERITVLHDVRRRTTLVGRQHGATLTELPNAGVLLTFAQADEDQCFKVLCTALLLAEMLDEMNALRHTAERVELKFRFGVHAATRVNDGTRTPHPDAVADALMLSAVAPEGTIATSREAFEQLSRPERFVVEELANPLLKTLSTSAHDQCVIVSAAADAYGAALDRQAELLRAQDDSISTPSTF